MFELAYSGAWYQSHSWHGDSKHAKEGEQEGALKYNCTCAESHTNHVKYIVEYLTLERPATQNLHQVKLVPFEQEPSQSHDAYEQSKDVKGHHS